MLSTLSHMSRSALWVGFFALILLAWWMMYVMAMDMDLDILGRPGPMGQNMAAMDPRMPMYMPMANFGPLFGMWAAMMAAMMLPTLIPTMRAYSDLTRTANGTTAGLLGVVLAYFLIWVGFAALITGVQLALLFGGVIDMLGVAKSPYVAAGLLIAVGVFQFTRAKEICHGVCHSPTLYFMTRWDPSFIGGLKMGAGLGAFCVGCCWGFMSLGFVGGVMNLAWMGLATLFMILEKLPQVGHVVTKPMGVLLILAGLLLIAMPELAYGG